MKMNTVNSVSEMEAVKSANKSFKNGLNSYNSQASNLNENFLNQTIDKKKQDPSSQANFEPFKTNDIQLENP